MAKASRSRADRERFWRKLIHEQQHGGQPVKAVCRRHRVSEPSYFAWPKRLAARELDIQSLVYCTVDGRLVITDMKNFILDIDEFGPTV